jgi:pyrophosphatase PpaX
LYLGTLSDERFDIIAREHMELQLKLYPTYLRAFPGVAEGLARLKHGGKHCAVVTSRRQDTLDLYLKETGLYDYFEIFVTPDSTLRHKPDAEPALKALSMFNASPDQAVFIGDSTFDIECAAAAGVDSVFVNWSSNDPSALAVLPTYRIDSMTELYQE